MADPSSALTPGADGEIDIPAAPHVAGLRFRAYRGEADLPAMVNVRNRAALANGESEVWEVASLGNELANPSHLDPREELVLGFVGERLVAISEIEWADTTAGQRHYRSVGTIDPEFRRLGIGTAMLARNEARLARLAAGHELDQPPRIISWLADRDIGGLELFRSRGYARVRVYHHMVRPDLDDIEISPLPAGLEVRPVRPDQVRTLWDGLMEAFRDHFGGHDGSDEAFLRWSQDPVLDIGLAVVAFAGDEIAAGVIGNIDAGENHAQGYLRGWADPVFTRRPWRRRGLANALLGRNLALLRDRGMTSAQLDVDSENPNAALGLYQRHGFVVDHSGSEWHRSLSATEARWG